HPERNIRRSAAKPYGRAARPLLTPATASRTRIGLAADKSRIEQRLFGLRIEGTDHGRLSRHVPHRSGVTALHQCIEAQLRLAQGLLVGGIEVVPAVASVIHHDLRRHPRTPLLLDETAKLMRD